MFLGRKELYRCPNRKSWVGERPEEDSYELQMGKGLEGRSPGEQESPKQCKTKPLLPSRKLESKMGNFVWTP